MKTLATTIFLICIFCIGTAVAEMSGKSGMQQKQEMSTMQSTQQMSHQMMNKEQMRNMTEFMQQMQSSVSEMNQLMQKHQMMNQIQLSEAAKVMEQMSTQMREMSKNMQAGKFDDKELAMLRKHHEEMTRNMERLQKTLQENQ